ncbi:hypothetical protein OS175_02355 [Marinicella sp. S1101]|uniref:hypothetical protein n=1 Tax=Marinicella marina TaxID=2996016 RepID=UPI0022608908|nr:hypothetical protein [Marinicella marina]MCX7552708.1 hypothetical protein [Marinicella marina]MDJ1139983.1 hypothetical protein [Marinicella marina]
MQKPNTSLLTFFFTLSVSTNTLAQNPLELILDGYAYEVFSDVLIDLPNKTFTIADSAASNCLQPSGSTPLNTPGNFTLETNNQDIGIERNRLVVAANLLYLTSETSNLLCDDGVFVDQIFVQSFDSTGI